jgi:hypothetical protein
MSNISLHGLSKSRWEELRSSVEGLIQIPKAPFHIGVPAHRFKQGLDGLDVFPGGRIEMLI